jgi:hypothetical protein
MPATFAEAVQEAAHAIVICMSEIECVERGMMAALERRRGGFGGLGQVAEWQGIVVREKLGCAMCA